MSEPPDWSAPRKEPVLSVSRGRMVALAIGSEAVLIGIAALLGTMLDIPFWENLHWRMPDVWAAVVLTAPLLAWAVWASNSSLMIHQQINRDFEQVVPMFRECGTVDLLGISILAGIGEEALFRGVLQPFSAGYTGAWPAIVIVGIAFGALHAVSWAYVIYASLIGIYLGALYLWYDNVLVPIAVHALYDFGALLYGVKIRPARP